MPQFDFTTYSSQIFWLALCFSILYFFVSNVILPRIREIQKERKSTIDGDLSATHATEKELQALQAKSNMLRREATKAYQIQLDEATKLASAKREKLIEELKERIDEITRKSQSDLKNFLVSSKDQSQSALQNLTQMIKAKLFNIS
jgi:F-type H+-transporting ATPase subunit b